MKMNKLFVYDTCNIRCKTFLHHCSIQILIQDFYPMQYRQYDMSYCYTYNKKQV